MQAAQGIVLIEPILDQTAAWSDRPMQHRPQAQLPGDRMGQAGFPRSRRVGHQQRPAQMDRRIHCQPHPFRLVGELVGFGSRQLEDFTASAGCLDTLRQVFHLFQYASSAALRASGFCSSRCQSRQGGGAGHNVSGSIRSPELVNRSQLIGVLVIAVRERWPGWPRGPGA